MAATCTAFEAEIATLPSGIRGRLAGPNARLTDAYARGLLDPAAHAVAKADPHDVEALTLWGKLTSFDAIAGP